MSPSPRPQTDDRIKIWLFRVSLFQDAYHICQNCLARPVQSLGEFHYWSEFSSPITLFLNGMHGSDRLKKKIIISFFQYDRSCQPVLTCGKCPYSEAGSFCKKKTDGNARLLEMERVQSNPVRTKPLGDNPGEQ